MSTDRSYNASANGEVAKVKGHQLRKSPPPVPPRPAKVLIKEALAKTRHAQELHATSGNVSKAERDESSSSSINEIANKTNRIGQVWRSVSFNKNHHQSDNARPVIYQSNNCKSRNSNSGSSSGGSSTNAQDDEERPPSKCLVRKESIRIEDVSSTLSHSSSSSSSSSNPDISSAPEKDPTPSTDDDKLNNRNHVNTLIDEMFASVLEVDVSTSTSRASTPESIGNNNNMTVIVISDNEPEKKVTFDDRKNHEFLIEELQSMSYQHDYQQQTESKQKMEDKEKEEEEQDKVSRRQRVAPLTHKIKTNDWYGVKEDGNKVKMSSCQIKVDEEPTYQDHQRIINISNDYGLPPLPKSLANIKFGDTLKRNNHNTDDLEENSGKPKTNLDKQLAILRREMDNLRKQDLSLLSKLWFLNESIQDFRQMLQEQEEKMNLTLPPSPTPSSLGDDDVYIVTTSTC